MCSDGTIDRSFLLKLIFLNFVFRNKLLNKCKTCSGVICVFSISISFILFRASDNNSGGTPERLLPMLVVIRNTSRLVFVSKVWNVSLKIVSLFWCFCLKTWLKSFFLPKSQSEVLLFSLMCTEWSLENLGISTIISRNSGWTSRIKFFHKVGSIDMWYIHVETLFITFRSLKDRNERILKINSCGNFSNAKYFSFVGSRIICSTVSPPGRKRLI